MEHGVGKLLGSYWGNLELALERRKRSPEQGTVAAEYRWWMIAWVDKLAPDSGLANIPSFIGDVRRGGSKIRRRMRAASQ
ncbi:uncharacterized protein CIMG_10861 [Coccidioides immitis RS]|uniref:Uncharacterized protein n=4 Tax=Coccidioides immitis TaxID=5501 RepID=A0A0D8JSX1_COCIM|nr:uncharacterized protein CIMG_10861 [Coccidioides immitis RS]KJF60076.1 hypothetical protein CIMG_10861 [Coccidioides immitis RS]KMP02053.1 hypothetical protein CIRG_02191 [Coccidioides immitis RMSCC 2394]KMU81559.1 hypothetical protein CISG_09292 [Coccidioides immitis RMSCC 3703]KMU88232.1 hypothetical protein CIHG_05402 [Coccidioides immitis H538.4]